MIKNTKQTPNHTNNCIPSQLILYILIIYIILVFSQTGNVRTVVFPVVYLNEVCEQTHTHFRHVVKTGFWRTIPILTVLVTSLWYLMVHTVLCLLSSPSSLLMRNIFEMWSLSQPSQSAVIDDTSAITLQAVAVVKNVVENIPFMLIGLGILLGGIFMVLMCRLKVPEVKL